MEISLLEMVYGERKWLTEEYQSQVTELILLKNRISAQGRVKGKF